MLDNVHNKSLSEAVSIMWQQGLLNKAAIERLYINNEVQRRVRGGENKTRAIAQVSMELECSYEKARAAVYYKKKLTKDEDKN